VTRAHVAFLALSLAVLPAAAETADSVQALRAELERMKVEQAERAAEMQKLEERLATLEAAAAPVGTPAASAPAVVAVAAPDEPKSRFEVSGDLRLRYEANYGAETGDWDRGTLRGRLGATYAATDAITIGARLATGDPDDPNSSDVTFSNFDDDFQVSLDMAYAAYSFGGAKAWGGKFALPFTRTDLVWDSDVNPQGVGATYKLPVGGAELRFSGLYFLVDHSVAGTDSSMIGGQVGMKMPVSEALKFDLAVAQYDYSLGSVAGADATDFGSNVIGPDGHYFSDYDLFNVLASATYEGWSRWPVALTGDYVVNRGARVAGDTGYSIELAAGQSHGRGDWRFGYGYSQAEVDAVLAAFSQDNTTIGTNYRQHTVFAAYNLLDNIVLDAVWYHYRPYDAEFSGLNDPDQWLDRVRLHFLVLF
jgi:hypothetical protein